MPFLFTRIVFASSNLTSAVPVAPLFTVNSISKRTLLSTVVIGAVVSAQLITPFPAVNPVMSADVVPLYSSLLVSYVYLIVIPAIPVVISDGILSRITGTFTVFPVAVASSNLSVAFSAGGVLDSNLP